MTFIQRLKVATQGVRWSALFRLAAPVCVLALCLGGGSAVPGQSTASTTKTLWGSPDLTGVWRVSAPLGATPSRDTLNLKRLEALYKPEAREKMKSLTANDDPMLHCVPDPFPYAAAWGSPIQIVQNPTFVVVMPEAFPTFRIIPTDGRPHTGPKYLYPVFMGDSRGHWEGDTLVVDVISFNGQGWLASGRDKPTADSSGVWPTSSQLHVIERWRRVDMDTLEYQARVEDPGMLTGAWESPKIILKRQPVKKIEEALCLLGGEKNYAKQWTQ